MCCLPLWTGIIHQKKKMKRALNLTLMTCLFFSACKKDDNSSSTITTLTVTNTLSGGNWRISYYWDTDHEETSKFAQYTFTFGSSSVLTAVKGATIITGTWSTILDDSKTKLVLNFSSPASFSEISDDWHVIERTDTRIKLQDVSGGNGGTDYLTFEKN